MAICSGVKLVGGCRMESQKLTSTNGTSYTSEQHDDEQKSQ